jgi:chemotaxis protein methyltransferase CheR
MSTAATPARAAQPYAPPHPYLIKIRDVVYQVAGIFQPDNKLRSFEDRVGKRMQVLGVNSFKDYYDCLTVKPIRQAELVALLNEITIGETCFFRNQPQLDALRTIVLPKIVEARAKIPIKHLRIWSAGCSTGEEPYTLSMIMMEEVADRMKGWTFEIQATDLNERSLAHCKHGVYGAYSTRNLTPYFKQKYFTERGDELQVKPEVKARVTFTRVNLSDNARMAFMKGMDIIFCCNVLIYFDVTSKRRVIQHFYNNLMPHGYFFLGHSESLYGISDDFRLVHMPSTTAYVKAETRKVQKA